MRCLSCNEALTDWESCRKHAVTGEYIDLCSNCFKEVPYPIPVKNPYFRSNVHEVTHDDHERE